MKSGGLPEVGDLSPEQRDVVEYRGGALAVSAGAGSGKTTTLMVKCRELLKAKPDARICAVSFTERSAADLRAKMTLLLEGREMSRHWVTTIHGFCGAVLRENPREAGFSGDESVLSETEARAFWDRAVLTLWEELDDPELESAVSRILDRETRSSLEGLLLRTRELAGFGVLESLRTVAGNDADAVALERIARHVLLRYDRQKRRAGVLDFADLETGADRALGFESVRAAYHRKFDFIVVDEFQDTNAVQARIIRGFTRPDLSNLCVVGDPKQSIYGFREADVTVFNAFRESIAEKKSLTWNYRSRPGIIEFANRVGEAAFPASNMEFQSLVPKRPASSTPDREVTLLEGAEMELAQWLVDRRDQDGENLGEYALLLRKIKGNEHWLQALRQAGIPIAVGSGGLLWEDPRARELIAFLQSWDNPAATLSAAIFLRAPWVSVSDVVLDGWCRAGKSPDLLGRFLEMDHPVALELRAYRGQILSPSELLLKLLAVPGLETELGAPLLALWHRCEELSDRGFCYQEVITELSEACRENRRERELPPPAESGQIRVLTLHGSKGLEFPKVILVDFAGKTRAHGAPLLFWDRIRGAFLGRRDLEGNREQDHPLEVEWREREAEKSLAESKRLFYVAATRARERLLLVFPPLSDRVRNAAAKETRGVYEIDDWRAWIESVGSALPLYREVLPAAAVRPNPISPRQAIDGAPSASVSALRVEDQKWMRPRHSVTEWNALAKNETEYRRRVARTAVDEADRQWDSRQLGNEIHRALENGDRDALRAIEIAVGPARFLAAPLIEWLESTPHFGADRTGFPELAFEIPVEGEVLLGVMDRVNRHAVDGAYSILDYKVVESGASGGEALEKYGAQLRLYAWALGRLEPKSRDRVRGFLVLIRRGEVSEVEVPLPVFSELETWVAQLSRNASRAIEITANSMTGFF
ncbi:MAG: UvrD-helicase domain-containing protein [Bdellovibrionota bacterium]